MFANATHEQIARIDDILRQLDQSQSGESSANRRRAQRINIRAAMTALVLSESGDASVQIFTRNISTSGIGFVGRRLCKAGERLALAFELPGKPHKLVLAQVTFCRYVRAGLYDSGAEFIECVTGRVNDRVPGHWISSVPIMINQTKGPQMPLRAARRS